MLSPDKLIRYLQQGLVDAEPIADEHLRNNNNSSYYYVIGRASAFGEILELMEISTPQTKEDLKRLAKELGATNEPKRT